MFKQFLVTFNFPFTLLDDKTDFSASVVKGNTKKM